MEQTLFEPKLKYVDEIQNELEHRLKPIEENENRVLRVIVNIMSIPIKIVTLFFDRRMKGKL